MLKKLNGRFALYRVKLDGSLATELVYANEQVDVDDVVRASRGARVIGVTFAEEQRRIVYFDPDYAALARSLARAIPNLPLIDFGDRQRRRQPDPGPRRQRCRCRPLLSSTTAPRAA